LEEKDMSLKEQLTADMKEAMKNKEKERLAVIRMVRGAIRQQEIDGQKELGEEDVIAVISKEVKMRRDSIEEFQKGGREDLVEKTQAEIDVLLPYLPAQLSEDEVRELVKAAVEQTGAATPKDMGKVMGVLMPKVKGRADGKMVNTIVKSFLQG
jgi:uncharacterized protein YqeY